MTYSPPSGRHPCSGTTPGSRSVRPSSSPATSSRVRAISDASADRARYAAPTPWLRRSSAAACDTITWLPAGSASAYRRTIPAGSRSSGTKCRTATNSTHTGRPEPISPRTAGSSSTSAGSHRSAWTTPPPPKGPRLAGVYR
nr:hypothetical protein [Actinomadura violacea]